MVYIRAYNWYTMVFFTKLDFTYRGEITVVPFGSQNFPSHSHI